MKMNVLSNFKMFTNNHKINFLIVSLISLLLLNFISCGMVTDNPEIPNNPGNDNNDNIMIFNRIVGNLEWANDKEIDNYETSITFSEGRPDVLSIKKYDGNGRVISNSQYRYSVLALSNTAARLDCMLLNSDGNQRTFLDVDLSQVNRGRLTVKNGSQLIVYVKQRAAVSFVLEDPSLATSYKITDLEGNILEGPIQLTGNRYWRSKNKFEIGKTYKIITSGNFICKQEFFVNKNGRNEIILNLRPHEDIPVVLSLSNMKENWNYVLKVTSMTNGEEKLLTQENFTATAPTMQYTSMKAFAYNENITVSVFGSERNEVSSQTKKLKLDDHSKNITLKMVDSTKVQFEITNPPLYCQLQYEILVNNEVVEGPVNISQSIFSTKYGYVLGSNIAIKISGVAGDTQYSYYGSVAASEYPNRITLTSEKVPVNITFNISNYSSYNPTNLSYEIISGSITKETGIITSNHFTSKLKYSTGYDYTIIISGSDNNYDYSGQKSFTFIFGNDVVVSIKGVASLKSVSDYLLKHSIKNTAEITDDVLKLPRKSEEFYYGTASMYQYDKYFVNRYTVQRPFMSIFETRWVDLCYSPTNYKCKRISDNVIEVTFYLAKAYASDYINGSFGYASDDATAEFSSLSPLVLRIDISDYKNNLFISRNNGSRETWKVN